MIDDRRSRFHLRRSPGPARRHPANSAARRDRLHRTVRLRQDDAAALPQPDERSRRRRAHYARRRFGSKASTSTRPESMWSICAGGSEWSFKNRIHFRNRSTTTSPTVCASPGSTKRSRIDEAVEKSLRSAALWDEVKDRLRRQRATDCPVASSSVSASRARSRSNRRSS